MGKKSISFFYYLKIVLYTFEAVEKIQWKFSNLNFMILGIIKRRKKCSEINYHE